MDRNAFQDRVRGVLFGHAVGDALGLGTEFLSKRQVKAYYPTGLQTVSHIVRDPHRRRWAVGDWTDDTDQMLCILDSLLSQQQVDILDIAARIHRWVYSGGLGIGRTVADVVLSHDFLTAPHSVAERIWRATGQQAAANGGVMRTSVLGVWQNDCLHDVKNHAEAVCKITHYDPRCVASCVVVCLIIRSLLREASSSPALLDDLILIADEYDPRVRDYMEKARSQDITDLQLDEPAAIGYTLKAMAAGIWAFLHPTTYRDGILAVIHEGGDADTNASVAGAILGAKFGFSGIPRQWATDLRRSDDLQVRVDRLLALL